MTFWLRATFTNRTNQYELQFELSNAARTTFKYTHDDTTNFSNFGFCLAHVLPPHGWVLGPLRRFLTYWPGEHGGPRQRTIQSLSLRGFGLLSYGCDCSLCYARDQRGLLEFHRQGRWLVGTGRHCWRSGSFWGPFGFRCQRHSGGGDVDHLCRRARAQRHLLNRHPPSCRRVAEASVAIYFGDRFGCELRLPGVPL